MSIYMIGNHNKFFKSLYYKYVVYCKTVLIYLNMVQWLIGVSRVRISLRLLVYIREHFDKVSLPNVLEIKQ